MKITHIEHGDVDGVEVRGGDSHWEKNGACYFNLLGWSEVTGKEWVPARLGIMGETWEHAFFPSEWHRLRSVEMYDFPDYAIDAIKLNESFDDLPAWLEQFKREALIYEEYK